MEEIKIPDHTVLVCFVARNPQDWQVGGSKEHLFSLSVRTFQGLNDVICKLTGFCYYTVLNKIVNLRFLSNLICVC